MNFYILPLLVAIWSGPCISHAATPLSHDEIKTELEVSALSYFIENANPETGLVRDQAESFGPTPDTNRVASIAATGFGLAVVANAAERGWVDPEWASDYFDQVMRDSVPRLHGWFLHWVDWQMVPHLSPAAGGVDAVVSR